MGTLDEHEACEVGRTTPISVAGRMIGNPLVAVISYLSVTFSGKWQGIFSAIWRLLRSLA